VGFSAQALAQSAPPTQITPSNDTGDKPFVSYASDTGSVNLANGNLSLNIPLVTLPGRNGLNFTLALQYNSKVWSPSSRVIDANNISYQWKSESHKWDVGDLGWRLSLPEAQLGADDVDQTGSDLGPDGSTVTLSDGSKHYVNGRAPAIDAQDGSGITGNNDSGHHLVSVQLKDGTVVFGTQGLFEDSNGNEISMVWPGSGPYTFTDTVKRTITYTPGDPTSSIAYKDSNGSNQSITLTFTSIPLFQTSGLYQTPQPPFTYPQATNCQGICHHFVYVSQPSAGNRKLLTSVTLADGNQYTFSYNGYGELTKVTFPTGGYVSYVYVTYTHQEMYWLSAAAVNIAGDFREVHEKHVCRDIAVSGSCPVSEDVTTFTPSVDQTLPNNSAMDVVDPMGYKNHHEFSQSDSVNVPQMTWPVETLHSVYSESGSLLRTTQTTYVYGDGCTCPLYPKDVTTTLNDTGGSTLVSKVHYDYDTYQATVMWPFYDPNNGIDYINQTATNRTEFIDNPTQVLEYNYGSGAAGTLARKTVNTWLKINAANSNVDYSSKSVHIWNRKATSQIWDGGTTKFAETDYEYDNYSTNTISASGAVQHDPAYDTNKKTRGNLTAIKRWRNTDGAMLTTSFAFDDAGNAVKAIDPLNHTTQMSYTDSWANSTCAPTPTGSAAASLTSVTDALSHVSSATYNTCTGSMASFSDQNSQVTSYSYDLMGRISEVDYPDGGVTTHTYFTSSKPFSVTIAKKLDASRGVYSQLTADGLGRVVQAVLCEDGSACAKKITTLTAYDGNGRTTTTTNPYRTTSDPTYGVTRTLYDALNRVCIVIPPDGTAVTGNSCPGTQPSNDVFTTYVGNTTAVTDQAGKKHKSVTDAMGRLVQVFEDPSGLNYETDYTYDVLDNLTCVEQHGGVAGTGCSSAPSNDATSPWRVRRFTYDSLSELRSAKNSESGTTTYDYYATGNLQTKTSPAPNQTGSATVVTSYVYDTLNRLTQKSYSGGTISTPTVNFTYDLSTVDGFNGITNPVGRLVRAVTSGTFTTKTYFEYDNVGRILVQGQCANINCGQWPSSPAWWIAANTYDFAGNLKTYTDGALGGAGITFTQNYDNAGRPTQLQSSWVDSTHPANLVTVDSTNGFWPNGLLQKFAFANGLTESDIYNNHFQPCHLVLFASGTGPSSCTDSPTNVLDFKLGYGASNNGNVMSWTATGAQSFNRSFTYDSLNRLATMNQSSGTAQTCSSAFALSWTTTSQYTGTDAWGNRTDQTVTSGTCPSVEVHRPVNSKNQFTTSCPPPTGNTCYDAAGNLLNDGIHTYIYDAENRIVNVDGGGAIYVYDAEGRRVGKAVGANVTYFIYGIDGQVVSERNASNTWIQTYARFAGSLTALYNGSTTAFYHQDHLGSTRLVTTYNAGSYAVAENIDYLPFGEQISGGTATTHKFTGKERDPESTLDNFGARYLTSTLGRFMSPDPLYIEAHRLADPQQLNLYAYARNNPVKFTDPTGLDITLNCDTKANCEKAVADFNNRKGAQFKVELGKDGKLRVVKGSQAKDLSKAEGALLGAINDTQNHATINVSGNTGQFEFGVHNGAGVNSVDLGNLSKLDSPSNEGGLNSGDALAHEALDAYYSLSMGAEAADWAAAALYPGLLGPTDNQPGWDELRTKLLGSTYNSAISNGSGTERITFKYITPIPAVDLFGKSPQAKQNAFRDAGSRVTGVTFVPPKQ
jgi:RHS repeat-associated protein